MDSASNSETTDDPVVSLDITQALGAMNDVLADVGAKACKAGGTPNAWKRIKMIQTCRVEFMRFFKRVKQASGPLCQPAKTR